MTGESLLLLGSDHTELGEVSVEELPPAIAIGISRGRFPKGYAHVDPNEDAVFASSAGTTMVLALADGHHGADAADAAILAIADAPPLTHGAQLESVVHNLVSVAIAAVADRIPGLDAPRDTSRTALTVCAIRDDSFAAVTLGDTSVFVVTRRRTIRVGSSTSFLGPGTDPNTINVDTGTLPTKGMIVLASDGFTDFTGSVQRSLKSATKQTAAQSTRSLIGDAFSGGAGDNVAVAIFKPRT